MSLPSNHFSLVRLCHIRTYFRFRFGFPCIIGTYVYKFIYKISYQRTLFYATNDGYIFESTADTHTHTQCILCIWCSRWWFMFAHISLFFSGSSALFILLIILKFPHLLVPKANDMIRMMEFFSPSLKYKKWIGSSAKYYIKCKITMKQTMEIVIIYRIYMSAAGRNLWKRFKSLDLLSLLATHFFHQQ